MKMPPISHFSTITAMLSSLILNSEFHILTCFTFLYKIYINIFLHTCYIKIIDGEFHYLIFFYNCIEDE